MKKSVFAILKDRAQAESVVERLKNAGFYSDDISMLFADPKGSKAFAIQHETKAPEGATAGAGTGFVAGGILGWLAGIGLLAIPGLGPLVAAGPIMAALSGAAVGTAVGGIVGALVGMGLPEYEARRYVSKVKEGNILVSVHTEDPGGIDRAKGILQECNAEDISSVTESAVKTSQSSGSMPT